MKIPAALTEHSDPGCLSHSLSALGCTRVSPLGLSTEPPEPLFGCSLETGGRKYVRIERERDLSEVRGGSTICMRVMLST